MALISERLKNDVALVTGAASGLDKAIALKLAENGAVVICADINDAGNEQTAAAIRETGGRAHTVHMDIADSASVKEAVKKAYSFEKRISIFINGAGIASDVTLDNCSDEEWFRVLNVNLSGYFYCARETAPYLKEAGGARVVMISSSSAKSGGTKGGPPYVASKGGVISLSRHCARYWAPFNIRCNCICPGFNPTNLGSDDPGLTDEENAKVKEATHAMFREKAKKSAPLGRTCTPEDIAGAVLFLVSEESAYVTGITLDVTGGEYIYNC